MALNLDARQRAMLQEMGVTVWAPTAAPQAAEPVPASAAPAAMAAVAEPVPVPPPSPSAPPRSAPAPEPARAPAASTAPAIPTLRADALPNGPAAFVLAPAQPAYPGASADPDAPGTGWLVVAECAQPGDPLAGDTGRLLDNMLRALQLHRHPRVHIVPLVRAEAGAEAAAGTGLAAELARHQPAVVLALGLPAARTVLGRTEPLGRLRAGPQSVQGTPVVVTYDPAYLLRAPQAKAAAWADLCRARALAIARPA